MKPKATYLLVVILLSTFLLVGWTAGGRSQTPRAWEYRVANILYEQLDSQLNELGAQGWELIIMEEWKTPVIRDNKEFWYKRCYFKRPR